ncbi:hypothetical protein [Aporhodopirellula aestuarii]|uniref:Uncharacterized protein n=1 Tax=Aporhodopirellula aestuarii TaxID=2950107 RepID=A0ABT0U0P6_9BACT|nr:hypothetical protein [Aporhodopirellula aestuarii]MCM2370415.1 hypothetical protein [Aporhodopirellula aestuarii]
MSFPISPVTALGVANLASRAVQGTVDAVTDFADVLGKGPDANEISSTDEAASIEATESIRSVLVDWMRQFGLQGDEPIDVSLDSETDLVQIESLGASLPDQSKIRDLQNRINSDESLKRSIVDSLEKIPGQTVSLGAR